MWPCSFRLMLLFCSLTPFVSPSFQVIRATICQPDALILGQFLIHLLRLLVTFSWSFLPPWLCFACWMQAESWRWNPYQNIQVSYPQILKPLGIICPRSRHLPLPGPTWAKKTEAGRREQLQRRVENLENEKGAFHFLIPSFHFKIHSYWLSSSFFHLFPEIQRCW